MNNVINQFEETRKKINSINFDVHWYRRVFHAFGACFLFYYMLPEVDWVNSIKFWAPLGIIVFGLLLEILRLKGVISSNHFFGLRVYEKNRVASYLFFGVAVFILLCFFPQQIAIPCILCACLADPAIGELRKKFQESIVIIFGFLLCFLFFIVTWYTADLWIVFLFSFVGAAGAVIGEVKKFSWIDDDFLIQILPALLLLLLSVIMTQFGFVISFEQVIYPGNMPW